MDGTQQVTRGLVATHSNGSLLLEPDEEVLDQVAGLVQVAVIAALVPARGFQGNHHSLTRFEQRLDDPGLRVISLEIRHPVQDSKMNRHLN